MMLAIFLALLYFVLGLVTAFLVFYISEEQVTNTEDLFFVVLLWPMIICVCLWAGFCHIFVKTINSAVEAKQKRKSQ